MELFSVLIYGLLIFIGTEVVSIPFGFILGYRESIGAPLSGNAQLWLRVIENISECLVVIWLISRISQTQSNNSFLAAFSAFGLAVLIAYPFDVLWAKQPPPEFLQEHCLPRSFVFPLGFILADGYLFTSGFDRVAGSTVYRRMYGGMPCTIGALPGLLRALPGLDSTF